MLIIDKRKLDRTVWTFVKSLAGRVYSPSVDMTAAEVDRSPPDLLCPTDPG